MILTTNIRILRRLTALLTSIALLILLGLARAIHVLVEASRPEDVKAVSKLVKEYSEKTSLKVVGIIVCNEVTDGLLSLLKELKDVEIVFTARAITICLMNYEYQLIKDPLFSNPEKQGIIKFKKKA
jgi:hypothetical protein